MNEGELSRHSSFSILFMDDLLLCFDGWDQASHLTKQLENLLSPRGLSLNADKTSIMSHSSMLDRSRAFLF